MISTDAEFQQTLEQMDRMYRALADLRREILPTNAGTFAVMAEGPLDYVRQFQAAIDEYLGTSNLIHQEVDVWMKLEGAGIEWPDAPTSVLTRFLNAFRKSVQTAAKIMTSGRLATRSQKKELKRSCDLCVVAFLPGSLRIGLRLPDASPILSTVEIEAFSQAEAALKACLDVASWADSGDGPEVLQGQVQDAMQRRVLLSSLKSLIPRPHDKVYVVELSGRLTPRREPIRLTREIHVRINEAIDRTVAQQMETHEGDVREIDLDQSSFTIRSIRDSQEISCEFGAELLDFVKKTLDRRVRVTGTRAIYSERRHAGKLRVDQLEVVDQNSID